MMRLVAIILAALALGGGVAYGAVVKPSSSCDRRCQQQVEREMLERIKSQARCGKAPR